MYFVFTSRVSPSTLNNSSWLPNTCEIQLRKSSTRIVTVKKRTGFREYYETGIPDSLCHLVCNQTTSDQRGGSLACWTESLALVGDPSRSLHALGGILRRFVIVCSWDRTSSVTRCRRNAPLSRNREECHEINRFLSLALRNRSACIHCSRFQPRSRHLAFKC